MRLEGEIFIEQDAWELNASMLKSIKEIPLIDVFHLNQSKPLKLLIK